MSSYYQIVPDNECKTSWACGNNFLVVFWLSRCMRGICLILYRSLSPTTNIETSSKFVSVSQLPVHLTLTNLLQHLHREHWNWSNKHALNIHINRVNSIKFDKSDMKNDYIIVCLIASQRQRRWTLHTSVSTSPKYLPIVPFFPHASML